MRLVSLCPSTTESLVALGAGSDLVGVTRYCVHPREALEGIRRVGGTKNPDLAAIEELSPDLVLCNAEENRATDIAALSARFRVDVSHPRRPREVPALLRRHGLLVGREREAALWAGRVEAAIAAAERERAPPYRFLCLIWKDPWMAVGDATYVSGVLGLSGGVNVLAGRPGPDYPVVGEEEVGSLRPEVLFLPDEPYPFSAEHRRFWAERLPSAAVESLPGDDLAWHGVRTLRGMEVAREVAARARARRPAA